MIAHERQRPLTPCPVCGAGASFVYSAEDHHYGNSGAFDLYGCHDCRHHFQHPIPTQEELSRYYPKSYYAYAPPPADVTLRGLRYRGLWLIAHFCKLFRGYRQPGLLPNPLFAFIGWCLIHKRKEFFPRYPAEGTACDFGCGSGSEVVVLDHLGWKAEGIELSEQAVTSARRVGVTISRGSIEVLESRPGAFDFICSSHCVEHVIDVTRLFRAFYTALKPDGILVIEVPNSSSAGMQRYRDKWYYLSLPVHVHLFSPDSIKLLAARNGFAEIMTRTISTSYMHAASWLLERDILSGKASAQFNTHAGWSVAFAMLACVRGFGQSIGSQRGDCLILSCRRPR
jgi:SAM-dependent methyltransferase